MTCRKWLLLCVFSVSCASGSTSSAPPVATPPATPLTRAVRVTIRSRETDAIVTPVDATLIVDSPSPDQPGLLYTTENDPSGRLTFVLDTRVPNGEWGATLHVNAPGFDGLDVRANLSTLDLPDVHLSPVFSSLPLLTSEKGHFKQSTARFTVIEASSFKLYQRYLEGGPASIEPVLTQLQSLGFNMVRVFGMAQNLWPFHPQDYGDQYYTSLPPFVSLLGRHGLYLEFTAFADTRLLMPDLNVQLAHWRRLGAVFADLPVLLELGNELDQHDNAVADLSAFTAPPHVCASRGSNGADNVPPRPAWCYEVYHSNDLNEWWRKVGHNAMELSDASGRPAFSNENTRAPDRLSSAAQARDAAASAALLAAGSCFHSVSGRDSVLFSPAEQELASAWVSGTHAVPLDCQDGLYYHRADLESPSILRAYQRGSDPACIVLIRK